MVVGRARDGWVLFLLLVEVAPGSVWGALWERQIDRDSEKPAQAGEIAERLLFCWTVPALPAFKRYDGEKCLSFHAASLRASRPSN